jgi:uncharacterized lipoprotein YddW (UPF0748 family)
MKQIYFVPAVLGLLATAGACAAAPPDVARDLSAGVGAQGRLMWIDGTANITRTVKQGDKKVVVDYSTTRTGVQEIVRKCKAAHINTLVIDVKPLAGLVLYNSRIAPRMRMWQGHPLPDFDVLAAFVEEGHKAGLQVDASINVLSEGHKYYSVGPAYQHTDWQSIVYTVDRGMVAVNQERLSIRAPGEPDDPAKPLLLADDSTVLGDSGTNGLVGLESKDTSGGVDNAVPLGKQLNIVLDSANRVAGMVDSALLGDDPLTAPENGHLVSVSRPEDRDWTAKNLHIGSAVRFDMRTGRTPIARAPSEKVACFVNPLHPEARRYELDMARELVANYAIDGLVLDRCRFSNINNDFSDRTRDAFAQWLQRQPQANRRGGGFPTVINQWPQDVFAFPATPGGPIKRGALYKPWMEFRAQTIRDFVADLARTVRAVKPQIVLGTYVGSWYPGYYEVGVNWGSPQNGIRYSWFTPNYPRTGYAQFFDWISTGCYYPNATEDDARMQGQNPQATVEFAAALSNQAVASSAFVYAGIYLQDYPRRPEMFLRALEACAQRSQGWMIFDLSLMDEQDLWPYLEKAYPTSAIAPHNVPGLLPSARAGFDIAD